MDGSVDPAPLYNAVKDGNTNFTAAPASGGGGGTGGDAATAAVTAAIGATAFGQIEWPSMAEQAESTLLGGEKSLMNDKPLLPFVQQLCNASLRHFQSLPDGRFYAFFPDYFGEFKAWVDSRVDDLLVLTDRAYAASINRREAHRVAMRTAQAGPSPHAVADLTRTEPRPRFDPNSVLS
jgi:hypothetical protein